MKRWTVSLASVLFLFLIYSPVVAKSITEFDKPKDTSKADFDSGIVSGLDTNWNAIPSPFTQQPGGFLLKIGNGRHGHIVFPAVLDAQNPIVIQIQKDEIRQVLASGGAYKAELIGKYLVYRGDQNSILYRYDTDKQSLREFVYLKKASDLAKNGNVIQWRFEGADLQLKNDGSVALTQTINIKNEVRKVSNNHMAERISRFLAKQRNTPEKPGVQTRTLFTIPKPEYIDGHGKTLTNGIQYKVADAKLTLHLNPQAKLTYPLWVDPTLQLRADSNADVILDGISSWGFFGFSVNSAGDFNGDGLDDVIVGAYYDSTNGHQSGSAYIFFGQNTNSQIKLSADTGSDVILHGTDNARFGFSVASAGDFNGDGLDDVIVGARDQGLFDTGSAYIFFGRNPQNPLILTSETDADVLIRGQTNYHSFGVSVASAGDFNGDGLGDIMVEEFVPEQYIPHRSQRVFMFFGRSSIGQISLGANTDANIIFDIGRRSNQSGISLAPAGDFNGDGQDDVILGGLNSRSAFIFFGQNPTSKLNLEAYSNSNIILEYQNYPYGNFGSSVDSAGDFNGDGLDDVIVGDNKYNNSGTVDSGRAYIFFGQSPANQINLDPEINADLIIEGQNSGDNFGARVGFVRDFNGDGLSDVIVGAYRADHNSEVDSGSAYIFFGQTATTPLLLKADSDANIILDGQSSNDFFGIPVTSAGDFNGDGLDDVVVGASYDDNNGLENSGSTFIFFSPFRTSFSFRDGESPDTSYTGTQDAYLMETQPSDNFGSLDHLLADGSELDNSTGTVGALASVIQWDLSSIPQDTAVDSATLVLNLSNVSDGEYYLYEMKNPWDEATVSWNDISQSGSIGTSILGTILPGVNGENVINLNADGLALVQGWVNGSIPNNGFIILSGGTTDDINFGSRESLTVTSRPKLTLAFNNGVLLNDTIPPLLTAPPDVGPIEATGINTSIDIGNPSVSDNVALYSVTNDAPASGFPLGATVVTWTAIDTFGNTATDTQNVTVQDTTAPAISTSDLTYYTQDLQLTVDIGFSAWANDNVQVATLTHNAPAIFPLGNTIVAWTATDTSGNTSTALQNVTVIQDTTPPVVTAPADVGPVEATTTNTFVYIGTATATDDGQVTSLTNDAPWYGFPVGTTVVTWTAIDAAGNVGSATQNVTVQDTTSPAVTAPADVTVSGTGPTAVTIGTATATDLVGVDSITNDAPPLFPIGITVVTWTATDSSGNTGTATQNVTVEENDTTPPVVTAPANVTAEATGPTTPVAIGTATATDNVAVASITSNAPASFPVGLTVVTWTATDTSGNTGTATQNVTIQDTTLPVVTAPANMTVEATGTTTPVAIGTATATDNVAVASITSNAPASFPVGLTVVTWTATDTSGNTGTSTQNVTVQDTTAPVVTAPANVTVEATGPTTPVAIGTATATDNVGVASITSNAPASFPVGTTVVTWTATDTSGNTGTASQNVTVQDTTVPVITLLGSSPVTVNTGDAYVDAGATATDTVDGSLTSSIVVGGLPINTSVAGTHTVTYNVTDSSGNAAAQVTRTVNVTAPAPPVTLSVVNVFDNKNGKNYFPGGPDGTDPLNDINSLAQEDKVEVLGDGSSFWWEADYADPDPALGNPSQVLVTVNYRPESGWTGTFTVQYRVGSTVLASTVLPGNSSGNAETFTWDLSSVVTTSGDLANGRVRFLNSDPSNGKKLFVSFSSTTATLGN